MWIIIPLVIILSILFIISFFIKTPPRERGNRGEKMVRYAIQKRSAYLNNAGSKDDKRFDFHNLLISYNNQSSEIDHIILSRKGIFVIETKYFSGEVYGSELNDKWIQVLAYGNVKHELYSPIKQNNTHIYRLSKLLNRRDIFHSVIVFPKAEVFVDSNTPVGNINIIEETYNNAAIILSFKEVNDLYHKLLYLKENPSITPRMHVQRIRMSRRQIAKNICPRCGGDLVLRKSSYGNFYGCENYPKCTFTKNI